MITSDLQAALGGGHVVTDPDRARGYLTSWTGERSSDDAVVVRPRSAEEVAAVVRICARHAMPIVPVGGQTGLVRGTTFDRPHVALSTDRLDAISDVDAVGGRMTVGAGVTIAAVHRACPSGWRFGVDFGARESATVGGALATNAGGLRVMRHGSMRRNVVGLEVVTADGAVVRDMRGLDKDNTGYDLTQLFAGSEGTLGIIVGARLRLVPHPGDRATALLTFSDVAAAVEGTAALQRRLLTLEVAELMLGPGLDLVARRLDRVSPLAGGGSAALLIESVSAGGAASELAEACEGLRGLVDAAVATSEASRQRLFDWRELHTESINALHPVLKLDISVPRGAIGEVISGLEETALRLGAGPVLIYGHVGDSSLHVSVLGPISDPPAVELALLGLVDACGGSPSAEHGVGRLRTAHLHMRRTPEEIAVLRAVKDVLDPGGRLNPGVLFA